MAESRDDSAAPEPGGVSRGRRLRLGVITTALAIFFLGTFIFFSWAQLQQSFRSEPLWIKVWIFVAAEFTLACGAYCALQTLEFCTGPGTRVTRWTHSAASRLMVVGAVGVVFAVFFLIMFYRMIAAQV